MRSAYPFVISPGIQGGLGNRSVVVGDLRNVTVWPDAAAALASVIVALLMSYQWGRAAEPPIVKVIRLHSVVSQR